MAVIELPNISKTFGEGIGRVQVLDNINFQADRGELSLILGPLRLREKYLFNDCWRTPDADQWYRSGRGEAPRQANVQGAGPAAAE